MRCFLLTTVNEIPEISPLGDRALSIRFGNEIRLDIHKRIQTVIQFLKQHPIPGVSEVVPSYTSVTLFYDPIQFYQHNETFSVSPYEHLKTIVLDKLTRINGAESAFFPRRTVRIPVCYGGAYGPDLTVVAERNGLSVEEVIRLHSAGDYLVNMIGFTPGFPYLGGLTEALHTPRRSEPRLKIPPGSVGIADSQTGVYPLETPGGWQLIGRTPVRLFDPESHTPSLLQSGDHVQFFPISTSDFTHYQEEGYDGHSN